jgi:hypothetical protein
MVGAQGLDHHGDLEQINSPAVSIGRAPASQMLAIAPDTQTGGSSSAAANLLRFAWLDLPSASRRGNVHDPKDFYIYLPLTM